MFDTQLAAYSNCALFLKLPCKTNSCCWSNYQKISISCSEKFLVCLMFVINSCCVLTTATWLSLVLCLGILHVVSDISVAALCYLV